MRVCCSVLLVATCVLSAAGLHSECTLGSSDEACSASPRAPASGEQLLLQTRAIRRHSSQEDPVELEEPSNASAPAEAHEEAPCNGRSVSRRRHRGRMCSCRRRHTNAIEDSEGGHTCSGSRMVPVVAPAVVQPCENCTACMCIFDIDRTLTGKQSDTERCPRNQELSLFDDGYGGGNATLSALAVEGLSSTFCGACYLGITSAGHGSGPDSEWNAYLLNNVMRSSKQDEFLSANPAFKRWSFGTSVRSPYVLGQSNRLKQHSVELIRRWYGENNVCIPSSNVYFFGDRTENIAPFTLHGLNSREISCGSRDENLHHGGVGYCGATPEEIVQEPGNVLCE